MSLASLIMFIGVPHPNVYTSSHRILLLKINTKILKAITTVPNARRLSVSAAGILHILDKDAQMMTYF